MYLTLYFYNEVIEKAIMKITRKILYQTVLLREKKSLRGRMYNSKSCCLEAKCTIKIHIVDNGYTIKPFSICLMWPYSYLTSSVTLPESQEPQMCQGPGPGPYYSSCS